MLTELSNDIQDFIETSRQYIPPLLKLLGALWIFNYINWKMGSPLNRWGIWPRHAQGLAGILLAPLLHSNFNHLLFNSVPLLCLSLFVISLNALLFYYATGIIIILAGVGVWLVGRSGIHIGASALIAGYFGYIVATAYERPTFTSFFCAGVAIYYFGGILLSLFPTEKTISWEGHLCGFLAGLVALFICTRYGYVFLALSF